ncbi:MAG: archease [archaeon]
MKYRFIDDLTSDVMFEAYGKDAKELFENAAMALMDVICKVDEVGEKTVREVTLEGESPDDLLINWLQAIIALVDTEGLFFSRFDIREISDTRMVAECFGSPVVRELGGTVVKAVTYYKFRLEQTKKGLCATVSLDI